MIHEVWKYPVEIIGQFQLAIPQDGQILSCQDQPPGSGRFHLWVRINPAAPKELRTFRVYGTGHRMPFVPSIETLDFVATVQTPPYVWHIFEQLTPEQVAASQLRKAIE
jgi:hypothetical protein